MVSFFSFKLLNNFDLHQAKQNRTNKKTMSTESNGTSTANVPSIQSQNRTTQTSVVLSDSCVNFQKGPGHNNW